MNKLNYKGIYKITMLKSHLAHHHYIELASRNGSFFVPREQKKNTKILLGIFLLHFRNIECFEDFG